MSSSVFFTGLVVVVGLALAVFVTPILLIPVGLLLVVALFAAPILAWWARVVGRPSTSGGAVEPGTPTTTDASYDPVDRPHGLAPRDGGAS